MRCTALILFALLATGCGGDASDDDAAPRTAPRPAAGSAADTVAGDTAAPGGARGQAEGRRGPGGEAGAAREAGAPARTGDGGQGGGPSSDDDAVDRERLYTVQVAAFVESSSAAEWTDRLRRQGMPVWTSVAEVGGRTFHRVRVGAVSTVAEARRLGSLITERYEWPVWVTRLTPADRMPEGAPQDTRRLLETG